MSVWPSMIYLMMTGSMVAAPLQQARGAEGVRAFNTAESRMFSILSGEAWELVLAHVERLDLEAEKMDRENHVLITERHRFGSSELEWLGTPEVDMPYRPREVEFHIFVSPFVEPARLYVGSVVRAMALSDRKRVRVIFNIPDVNSALVEQFEIALGQKGLPISRDVDERLELSLALRGEDHDPCQGITAQGFAVIDAEERLQPPKKIQITEIPIAYPAAARGAGVQGTVTVKLTILEDGAVVSPQLQDETRGYQLLSAALGPLSLLRYRPARLKGCPVPTLVDYTVRFQAR
jgi:TonB family protein